jgi:hypothetical protein
MDEDRIERVAAAIDAVRLFSRFNDWTSDRVPGQPVEICRYGKDDEPEVVVVSRFSEGVPEAAALALCVRRARAVAAINAMSASQ